MEKIGAGLSMLRLAPSKSGVEAPSAPTMTVQVPDTGGRTGNSKGGAGNVTRGSAVATAGTSINATKAVHRRPARPLAILSRRVAPVDFSATAIRPLTPSASSALVIFISRRRNPAL